MTSIQQIGAKVKVANYGELADTIGLSSNLPAGWSSSFIPASCSLGSGSSCNPDWTITVPASGNGKYTSVAVATSQGNPAKYANATLISYIDTSSPNMEIIDYSGTETSFTIDWNATYNYYNERGVAVQCVLNCDLQQSSCEVAEKCEPNPSIHPAGLGGCSVSNPTYNPGTEEYFSCKIYDPVDTSLVSYKKVYYSSVGFDVSVSDVSATVGEAFNLPVNVKNTGVLQDNYHVVLEPLPISEQYVSIENGDTYTETASSNETVTAAPRVTVMFMGESIHLRATVASAAEPSIEKVVEIEITAGETSMTESPLVPLQVMLLAAVLLLARTLL